MSPEEKSMQIVSHAKPDETRTSAEPSPRTLLWACAGLIETLCLMGGLFWILSADDPRPLGLRVVLVSALAALCGVGTLLAFLRLGRD
jgi:hypothetical protein